MNIIKTLSLIPIMPSKSKIGAEVAIEKPVSRQEDAVQKIQQQKSRSLSVSLELKHPKMETENVKNVSTFTEKGKEKFPANLTMQRDMAFNSGEPFFFVKEKGSKSFVVCSVFYDNVDRKDLEKEKETADVFYVKKGDSKVYEIGTITEIEADKNPLGHHLLMLNDDVFLASELQNGESHQRSLAACSILFGSGMLVEQDKSMQESLLAKMNQAVKDLTFGELILESLEEHDFSFAEKCIDHGATVRSVDQHGHSALPSAIVPGCEKFIDIFISRTAKQEDTSLLVTALQYAHTYKLSEAASILEKHLSRLRAQG